MKCKMPNMVVATFFSSFGLFSCALFCDKYICMKISGKIIFWMLVCCSSFWSFVSGLVAECSFFNKQNMGFKQIKTCILHSIKTIIPKTWILAEQTFMTTWQRIKLQSLPFLLHWNSKQDQNQESKFMLFLELNHSTKKCFQFIAREVYPPNWPSLLQNSIHGSCLIG